MNTNTELTRSGQFWDAMEGRAPLPRAAATLGMEFVRANPERRSIELAFNATEAFTNPMGNVLGAFLAAMLYDTVGSALLATLEPDQFQSTVEITVRFHRPVKPGRLVGRGRVVVRNRSAAIVEASLLDQNAALIASATAVARIIPLAQAEAAV